MRKASLLLLAAGLTAGCGVTEGRIEGEGPRVRYNVTDVQAAGIGLPNRVADLISERINPVVDLSRMRIPLQVTGVRVDGRAIIAEATGSLQEPVPIPGTGSR